MNDINNTNRATNQNSRTRVFRNGPAQPTEKTAGEPTVVRKVFNQNNNRKPIQPNAQQPRPAGQQNNNNGPRRNNGPRGNFNNNRRLANDRNDMPRSAELDAPLESSFVAPISAMSKRPMRRRPSPRPQQRVPGSNSPIPPLAAGDIRVVPICGTEWIGTNMSMVEFNNEIIIVDAGFGFKNPDLPGINYTIPNTKYLEERKHMIKAIVITHGHMDHVGALPYVIEKLGNPPIYTLEFGAIFIQKRMEEFPQIPKLNMIVVDSDSGYINISENFKVKFFGLTHTIPDSSGVIVKTQHGGIVFTGDVRVENRDGVPVPEEIEQYKFFKDENVLLLAMDSTGAPIPGWATSEGLVRETLDGIIKDAPGRLFIAAFSSQVERLMSFLESAKKYNKYVVIDGRSMKTNLGIAEFLKLTDFSHIIPIEDIDKYPNDKVMVILTGGQGEEYSALQRLSIGDHRFLKLIPTDTIVLSASVVPGNEYPVDKLKDELFRTQAKVITYNDNVVHASGHGKREELRWLHKQIPYKFFMPVHGRHWFLRMNAQIAIENGTPKDNIVIPENGSIIEIRKNGTEMITLPMKAVDSTCWIVDGAYMGPVQEVLMEDRKVLGTDGMFVVSAVLDLKRKALVKSPDIASRGHTYLRESRDLLTRVRILVKRTCEHRMQGTNPYNLDMDQLKKEINDRVSKYIAQKTLKNPIVMTILTTIN